MNKPTQTEKALPENGMATEWKSQDTNSSLQMWAPALPHTIAEFLSYLNVLIHSFDLISQEGLSISQLKKGLAEEIRVRNEDRRDCPFVELLEISVAL